MSKQLLYELSKESSWDVLFLLILFLILSLYFFIGWSRWDAYELAKLT